MAYCGRADIEKIFGAGAVRAMVDADGSGVVNSEEAGFVTEAIASADEDIDSALNAIYAVPFSTVPAIIKRLSVQMSFYYLCFRSGRQLNLAQGIYERTWEEIEKLQAGRMTIKSTSRIDAAGAVDAADEAVFNRTKTDRQGNETNDVTGSMDTW